MSNEDMRCDLCGGQSFETLSERDRHGRPLRTVICEGCGLVMHSPVPDEDALARYYAEHYRMDYHGERTPSPRRVMRAWKNGERIFGRLQPMLKGGERVLEIGAGLGCTVKVFDMHGFDASGIEPNRDFNAWSREKLKARVENTNLYDLPAEARADLILLIHVIEHFSSPRRALTHIHGLLADGGRLYLECPNLTGPFATFGRMFHFAHVYNFTPQTLATLARECGFIVERAFNGPDDPDIEILLRKATPEPDAHRRLSGHAEEVKARLRRFSWLRYHLRGDYWKRRMRKLAGYLREYLTARRFVRRLLDRLARR
ncbi:MAG: class I SAM-dependent methyltransferase [Mariprofundaceae bacterium]